MRRHLSAEPFSLVWQPSATPVSFAVRRVIPLFCLRFIVSLEHKELSKEWVHRDMGTNSLSSIMFASPPGNCEMGSSSGAHTRYQLMLKSSHWTGVICAPEKLWCAQHMVPIHPYYPNYKYQHKAGNKANSLSFTDQLLQVISQFSFTMEIVEHWTGWGKVTPDLMFNFLINSQKGENKGKLGAVAVQHVPGWTFESKQCKIMESIRLEKTF